MQLVGIESGAAPDSTGGSGSTLTQLLTMETVNLTVGKNEIFLSLGYDSEGNLNHARFQFPLYEEGMEVYRTYDPEKGQWVAMLDAGDKAEFDIVVEPESPIWGPHLITNIPLSLKEEDVYVHTTLVQPQ